MCQHSQRRTPHPPDPPDLDGINPDMHRCCHQGCALQVAANDSEVSGTCVTWCEKLPSWGSMMKCCLAQKCVNSIAAFLLLSSRVPKFSRNPASPPQGMQPSQPLAITREHSDRSQRGYANLKRWATWSDVSDSFRKATPQAKFPAKANWVPCARLLSQSLPIFSWSKVGMQKAKWHHYKAYQRSVAFVVFCHVSSVSHQAKKPLCAEILRSEHCAWRKAGP